MFSMLQLPKRQRQVLNFIEAFQKDEGKSPSFREICGHFGFKSTKAAADHVKALTKKGFLTFSPRQKRSIQVVSPFRKLRKPTFDIPVFGSIPAGFAENKEQGAEGCISVDVNSIGYKPTKNSFALRVSGESMIGRHIMSGDYVILEHGPDPRNGDIVAALIDGECTLKTYVIKGGKPYLKAENPKYPNLIPAHELVIQGVFRSLIRPAIR